MEAISFFFGFRKELPIVMTSATFVIFSAVLLMTFGAGSCGQCESIPTVKNFNITRVRFEKFVISTRKIIKVDSLLVPGRQSWNLLILVFLASTTKSRPIL